MYQFIDRSKELVFVIHVGLKPTSAGLEAAAQSLYQWDK